MTYFDASALVKRYVREKGRSRVERILRTDVVATSRISYVEIASALARRCREGGLAPGDRDRALDALEKDFGLLQVVELTGAVARRSLALLRSHSLRAGDAVQLASAVELARELRISVAFLAFDDRLQRAAAEEGLVSRD